MSSQHLRAAVDVGGTFTDIQLLDTRNGTTWAFKTPTTPDDPSQGIVAGLKAICARHALSPADIGTLMHGTTIATNAVLERKLARGILLTTKGFEDVLEIGRHVRSDIYSAIAEERTLLVPRQWRLGVAERMRADGTVETALSPSSAEALAAQVSALDVDAVAICLLHAYANDAHEQQLAQAIRTAHPNLQVCTSASISPELREFERTSTTVLNALLMPVVGAYLSRLEHALLDAGLRTTLYLFQSNGGVLSAAQAAASPVRLLLSGPAGGALAVSTIGHQSDTPNLVGIDMGGTSFDVCVVERGRTREVTQGAIAGCPVRVPMTEIRTISAGGGSIASVDGAGRLRVGPESAGARPGPAAYGYGGQAATVTDANVVLGRLDARNFLDGAMQLDIKAAADILSDSVGKALGVTPQAAGEGVLRVAVAEMANAIRLSLFEKGLDPRDFALISFGGAGGLHAAEVADELGATAVLYPSDAATLSAWGMLYADVTQDYAATRLLAASDDNVAALDALVKPMLKTAAATLQREGFADEDCSFELLADMRYRGQAYEISVPWGSLPAKVPVKLIETDRVTRAAATLHDLHEAQFAHCDRDATPEIITMRLRATGRLPKPVGQAAREAHAENGTQRTRCVHLANNQEEIPVLEANTVDAQPIAGPLLVEASRTTLFIPAGWQIRQGAANCLAATRIKTT
jgi:N-methylhydantoinase A